MSTGILFIADQKKMYDKIATALNLELKKISKYCSLSPSGHSFASTRIKLEFEEISWNFSCWNGANHYYMYSIGVNVCNAVAHVLTFMHLIWQNQRTCSFGCETEFHVFLLLLWHLLQATKSINGTHKQTENNNHFVPFFSSGCFSIR